MACEADGAEARMGPQTCSWLYDQTTCVVLPAHAPYSQTREPEPDQISPALKGQPGERWTLDEVASQKKGRKLEDDGNKAGM